jgi:hypothetical protein
MSIPGFTAESSLYTTVGYRLTLAHQGTAGQVVPQLPTSRVCTKCDGIFLGSQRCCDVEIVSCSPPFQGCVVNFTNCATESCGFLHDVGVVLGGIFT